MSQNLKNHLLNKFVLLFVSVLVLFVGTNVYSQSLSDAVIDHRTKLQQELNQIESEIAGFQSLIDGKRNEAASLERDIAILDAEIGKTKLEIKAIDVSIQTLSGKILDKESTIEDIIQKVDREKLSLAESMRSLNERDGTSILEIMLSYQRLSDFLDDVESIDVIQSALQESFEELRATKQEEEVEKNSLIDQKVETSEFRTLQVAEQKKLQSKEAERKELLRITRGEETVYQGLQNTKKRSAASIRSQLFLLQGSPAIPFEKAVAFAENAKTKTGVRVAFVLGVIAQESELGKNIGQCNLPEDPPKYKWQAIMKPSRDHEPYLRITSSLGLDPNLMPLSCPLSVGWGGAMGPAQFIPSTWVLFEDKIAQATGHNPPNPWEPEDAFMASSIFLSELGAHTEAGEFEAAARYFAGGNWQSSLGRTYANQVLSKVATYQEQIDFISGF